MHEAATGTMRREIEPVLRGPSERRPAMAPTSPIGDSVTGMEGLRRLARRSRHHGGQVWLIRNLAGLPKA
jgi:hypothetical protein